MTPTPSPIIVTSTVDTGSTHSLRILTKTARMKHLEDRRYRKARKHRNDLTASANFQGHGESGLVGRMALGGEPMQIHPFGAELGESDLQPPGPTVHELEGRTAVDSREIGSAPPVYFSDRHGGAAAVGMQGNQLPPELMTTRQVRQPGPRHPERKRRLFEGSSYGVPRGLRQSVSYSEGMHVPPMRAVEVPGDGICGYGSSSRLHDFQGNFGAARSCTWVPKADTVTAGVLTLEMLQNPPNEVWDGPKEVTANLLISPSQPPDEDTEAAEAAFWFAYTTIEPRPKVILAIIVVVAPVGLFLLGSLFGFHLHQRRNRAERRAQESGPETTFTHNTSIATRKKARELDGQPRAQLVVLAGPACPPVPAELLGSNQLVNLVELDGSNMKSQSYDHNKAER
ncbi:hypothetical protein V8F20_010924 [Naviculisporaceae sp. PSN 640]